MPLEQFVAPWSGDLLRHRPRASTRSVLEDTYVGQVDDNRWSARGVRAYYFALDRGIVIAEHARHVGAELPVGHRERIERSVFRVHADLDRTLDLTRPEVVAAMGAGPINTWILEIAKTQAVGAYLLTQVRDLGGLIVPSVAFLDDHARYNVVVLRDAIDPDTAFTAPVFVMDIILEANGAQEP